MKFKISVIIPVYNAEDYLSDAMNSLLNQTLGFEALQVIFVDDCSVDKSLSILNDYARKYENVEVYRTESNSGAPGYPRNIGLEHAMAPYVMFLDPDDFYLTDACKVLYEKICETKVDIVGGRFYCVDADGKNPICGEAGFPDKETHYVMPRDLMALIHLIQPIWQRIFDLDFIRKHKISFQEGCGEDNVFLNQCFVTGCTVVQIGDYILNYRMQPRSITKSAGKGFFKGYVPCAVALEKLLKPYPEALNARKSKDVNWYMSKLMSEFDLGKDEIIEIFQNCKAVFIRLFSGNKDYVLKSSG